MNNQILKKIYYRLRPFSWPTEVNADFAYIFHTEQIYDQKLYENLLEFCRHYFDLTSKKPICTLMTGVNARVVRGCKEHGVSAQEYVNRAHALSEVSTLGYHGHFWSDPLRTESPDSQMRGIRFDAEPFAVQFEADLAWFQENGLSHHGLYAAGWWFTHPQVIKALMKENFKADFSFSKSLYFSNPFSKKIMDRYEVPCGQSFSLEDFGKKILCIQNFIGCNPSPFPEDFIRNMEKLIKNEKNILGVVNSHDYDLQSKNTLKCIEALIKNPSVHFLDGEDLLKRATQSTLATLALCYNE